MFDIAEAQNCSKCMIMPSAGDSRRRWLAYNLLGCISSRLEEGQSVIEVAFHDAPSHKRVPLFSDFRDFCMASLGPKVLCGQCMLLQPLVLRMHCEQVSLHGCRARSTRVQLRCARRP